jgi:hypothetical protein
LSTTVWPLLLLAQNIAGCIAQAVGFTGLLLFVLRVPNDEPDPRWRRLERALPLIVLVLTLLLLASYGSVFGYRTETGTRAGILSGFVVGCATRELNLEQPIFAAVSTGQPFGLEERDDDGIDFPPGLRRPVLGVPAADPVRCFALSLYGPHAVGTDLNANERAMLSRLARFAAAMYAELEAVELHHRIAMLERKFKAR